jgi:two-component system phosphate regulon sensor histidine kinase PhoR
MTNQTFLYYILPGYLITLALVIGIMRYQSMRIKGLLDKLRDARGVKDNKYRRDKEVFKSMEAEIIGWSEDRRLEIEQMQKLENYRKEYLGNVSHELKTPIFNIQGYLHTLLDGGIDDPSINRNYLQRAASSVDRMIHIVEDLQAISMLEAGELELEFDRFDVLALTRDIIDSLEMRGKEKKIDLILKHTAEEKVFVYADRQRIRQVITNLITNSIRYGKEGGETKIRYNDTGVKVIAEVADTGIGIPDKFLPRIFERFYRVDKGRSREQGGTGLGLAIVKHIVEAHRQTIGVMSTEGVGSVFTFTLQKS